MVWLIIIDCFDQLVEIDDTLISFIDLSRFYWFHQFILEDTSVLLFIQKGNLISCKQWICWQLNCNWESKDQAINLLSLFKKKTLKKSHVFFKTCFKVFVWWPILARFFMIKICHPLKITSHSVLCVVTSRSSR